MERQRGREEDSQTEMKKRRTVGSSVFLLSPFFVCFSGCSFEEVVSASKMKGRWVEENARDVVSYASFFVEREGETGRRVKAAQFTQITYACPEKEETKRET